MEYPELLRKLVASDFRRIERDDRLLDVFPGEDREKGIELWEKWEKDSIKIVRIHLPFSGPFDGANFQVFLGKDLAPLRVNLSKSWPSGKNLSKIDKKTWFYQIPRQDIEQALLKNDHLLLAEYQPVNLSDSSV